MSYSLFRERMALKSGHSGDRKKEQTKNYIRGRFEDDPSFARKEVACPEGNKEVKRFRFVNESFVKQLNPERTYAKYAVLHPDEEISSGSIVHNVDERDWLVTSRASVSEVVTQVMLLKMVHRIKWVDQKTGEIKEHKIFVRAVSEVSDGILGTQMFIKPDELIEIKVQENDDTMSLKTGDRFVLRSKVYRIWKRDIYTDENIIQFICQQDMEEDEDNTSLGLTGEDIKELEKPRNMYIKGRDTIFYKTTRTYTLLDENGFEEPAEWEIEDPRESVSLEIANGKAVLTALDKVGLNGAQIQLKAIRAGGDEFYKTVRFVMG